MACIKYIAVIAAIFGLELKVKNYIEDNSTEGTDKKKCSNMLIIRKHHNKGMFLNAGENRQKLVMVISVLLTIATTVIFVLTLGQTGHGLLKWGLTFFLGGAYSNTYDRMVRKYVVDYVSFNVPFKWLRRIIFNIGDFCIMIGALLSVIGYYQK